MKVYVHNKGVVLVGKGWEISAKLREYAVHYPSVNEWMDSVIGNAQAPMSAPTSATSRGWAACARHHSS
jgi:hypothetical protein